MEHLNWSEFTEDKYNEMVNAIQAHAEYKFEYYALQFMDEGMNEYQLEINPIALGSDKEWAVDIMFFDKIGEDYDGSLASGYYEDALPTFTEFKKDVEDLAQKSIEIYGNKTVEAEHDKEQFNYNLLARLQQDCKYVLDTCVQENGLSLESSVKHLWAKSPKEQIEKMQELYDNLPIKPEWLTQADIDTYATRFGVSNAQANELSIDQSYTFTERDNNSAKTNDNRKKNDIERE